MTQPPPSPTLSFTPSIPETKPALSISQVQETEPERETEPDYDPSIGAHPSSPFYRHATPSSRFARLTSPQRKRSRSIATGMGCSPIDDLEGQRLPFKRLYDDEGRNLDAGIESGVGTTANRNMRELKLWAQEKRHCDCLAGLTKRQQLWVKIAMAVVIVGSMVAVALGITAAVGGGVWSGENQSEQLP